MFRICVGDNSRYMDDGENRAQGEFATWDEAVAAARRLVDRSLAEHYRSGMSSDALFSAYTAFGEDPYIVPTPPGLHFSAWDYARERCATLCAPPHPE